MTKYIKIIFTACIVLSAATTSCKKDSKVKEFTVTFDSNDGSEVPIQTVKDGDKITAPANPTKQEGAIELYFRGWYATGAATAFDFNTPVIDNITLSAKWFEPLGRWKNNDDYAGWGTDDITVLTETVWIQDDIPYSISSWTKRSNGDAASKDDYPEGYFVVCSWGNGFLYLHKTNPDKIFIFYGNDGNYDWGKYNIFTRQE